MNLNFWRSLIHSQQIKKVIILFELSSVIANKFGSISEGHTLTLTRFFPKDKNLRDRMLYLYEVKDQNLLGYAFKDHYSGQIIRGTVDKSHLNCSNDVNRLFANKEWKGGRVFT